MRRSQAVAALITLVLRRQRRNLVQREQHLGASGLQRPRRRLRLD